MFFSKRNFLDSQIALWKTSRYTFCWKAENIALPKFRNYFFEDLCFIKGHFGHVECSFRKPVEIFQLASCLFHAQKPKKLTSFQLFFKRFSKMIQIKFIFKVWYLSSNLLALHDCTFQFISKSLNQQPSIRGRLLKK